MRFVLVDFPDAQDEYKKIGRIYFFDERKNTAHLMAENLDLEQVMSL